MRRSIPERLRMKGIRLIRRVLPRFGLRPSDVLLASFPKSGNTWVRFIWANVVSLRELGGKTVDFHRLSEELGHEYDVHRYGDVEFDCLPRLVKTHEPYDDRAFGLNRSVYLYRHPGDVMVSYWHYMSRRWSSSPAPEEWDAFLRDDEYGVPAWCRHVRSWREEADALLSYAELRADAAGAVARLLEELGLGAVPDGTLREAARRSSFQRVRELEEERGLPDEDRADEDYRFTRSGARGEWREVFGTAQRNYLRERVRESGLTDLVEAVEGASP